MPIAYVGVDFLKLGLKPVIAPGAVSFEFLHFSAELRYFVGIGAFEDAIQQVYDFRKVSLFRCMLNIQGQTNTRQSIEAEILRRNLPRAKAGPLPIHGGPLLQAL